MSDDAYCYTELRILLSERDREVAHLNLLLREALQGVLPLGLDARIKAALGIHYGAKQRAEYTGDATAPRIGLVNEV